MNCNDYTLKCIYIYTVYILMSDYVYLHMYTHTTYIFYPGPIENGWGWSGLTFRAAVSRSFEQRNHFFWKRGWNAIPIYAHDLARVQYVSKKYIFDVLSRPNLSSYKVPKTIL